MNATAAATTAVLSRAWDGPRHLLFGYRLLLRPGVRRFMLIPLFGNMLLYLGAFVLAFWGLDWALDRWLPAAADWLRWLLYPLLALVLTVLAFFTFTLLGNLLLAPFNGLLAEQVERSLTGTVTRPREETLSQSMRRSLRLAAWRLGFILIRVGAVFLLGLIPVVGVIALPVGLLLGAWLLALEFSDSPLGNWGWTLSQQRELVRANRAGFIAFGLTAMGLSLVPVLNFALIPAAVAGMTAYCLPLRAAVPRSAEPVAAG
jgi:CysZ protein